MEDGLKLSLVWPGGVTVRALYSGSTPAAIPISGNNLKQVSIPMKAPLFFWGEILKIPYNSVELEGKYSLESTDPRESEIRAPSSTPTILNELRGAVRLCAI